MAIVVIGRGVDLAIVTTYAMSAAWTLHLASLGVAIAPALLLGFLLALTVGVINGVLIAYVEIPALFATLGMAALGLRLRSLGVGPTPCRLLAAERQCHRLDRRWFRLGRADPHPVFWR
jgi:ribose/xylose/arabinose/galactoside ABC-type transport system permease subunit